MDDLEKELEALLAEDEQQPSVPPAANRGGDGSPQTPLPQGVKATIFKLRDKGRTLEQENLRLQQELDKTKPPVPPAQPVPPPATGVSAEEVQLLVQGYKQDEIAFIKRNTPPGKSILETVQDPMVASAIEGVRAKDTTRQNTPPPSNRTGIVLPPGKRMKDLTPQERVKAQEEIIARNRAIKTGQLR